MNGTPQVEPVRISDWLLYEEDGIGRFSRDIVPVAASPALACGAVVALDANGAVVEYDPDDAATAPAAGIITEAVTTGATESVKAVIIARHARIVPDQLTWKAGTGEADRHAALSALSALGIVQVQVGLILTPSDPE